MDAPSAPPPVVSAAAAAAEARRQKVLARGAERLAAITVPGGREYSQGVRESARFFFLFFSRGVRGGGEGASTRIQRAIHPARVCAQCPGTRQAEAMGKDATASTSTLKKKSSPFFVSPSPSSLSSRTRRPRPARARCRGGGQARASSPTRPSPCAISSTAACLGPPRPGRGGRAGRAARRRAAARARRAPAGCCG